MLQLSCPLFAILGDGLDDRLHMNQSNPTVDHQTELKLLVAAQTAIFCDKNPVEIQNPSDEVPQVFDSGQAQSSKHAVCRRCILKSSTSLVRKHSFN